MKHLHRRFTSLVALLVAVFAISACSDGNNNNNNNDLGNIVEVALSLDGFSTLVTALQATGLDAVLADEDEVFTVFAPTDDAFALLGEEVINALLADIDTLTDILLYHVIAGGIVDSETAIGLAAALVEMANGDNVAVTVRDGELFINNSQVIVRDVEASNGIIHAIDVVLIPPEDTEPTGNIVEVAVATPGFETLVAAVVAAGLDSVLADESRNFTVFAPTDEAFAALGEETINGLLADIPTLSDILLYHVVADAVVDSITALTLVGTDAGMANGDPAPIGLEGTTLTIAGANIIVTNVPATNGVIHVLDAVIIPPAD